MPVDPETSTRLKDSNLTYLAETSVELSAALDTQILILDNQGLVLVDSRRIDEGRDLSGSEEVAASLRGEHGSKIKLENGEQRLFVSTPIRVEDQIVGVIYLSQPLRDVTAVLSDLANRLLLALGLAIPLSAVVGLLLARTISRPLQVLTTAAGKLAEGDFEYQLPTQRRDELGQLSRTFASMRNRLKAVEQMRTQFVSDVSHELRTPLTGIKGFVETLRDGAADDPNVRDRFLASMESETDRLIRLVNDLLTLSRADAHALSLHLNSPTYQPWQKQQWRK